MIAALPKKIREGLSGNLDKKLGVALAEIRRLDTRYKEICTELRRKVDCSLFATLVKEATAKFQQSQSPEDLRSLILEEMIAEKAQERVAGLYRSVHYGNAAQQQFAAEFPNARDTLTTACELRLAIARAELERVTAAETARLDDEYDNEEIGSSPVVRRAADAVRNFEFRLKAIQASTGWSQVEAMLND